MSPALIDDLVRHFARLPGLGPRSGRRLVIHLLARHDDGLRRLAQLLLHVAERVRPCQRCGNLDEHDPCMLCRDPKRDRRFLCVVEGVSELWAIERSGAFPGEYFTLGGCLSAIDGRGPEDIGLEALRVRSQNPELKEIILALSSTLEGQTTAHVLAQELKRPGLSISRLGQGVPIGGELDYLDDGTLLAALRARRPTENQPPSSDLGMGIPAALPLCENTKAHRDV